MTNTTVGRVIGLWRYPVKSMAGEALREAEVSWHGFAGDRRWAFVRENAGRSGFPWFTLRERGDMNHYRPTFDQPEHPNSSRTHVRTPEGQVFDITDPALASELSPLGLRAIKQDRGVFDTFPLSVITTQTISALSEMTDHKLEVERFRPNLLVEGAGDEQFPEDQWLGRTLQIGTARMRIDKRDGRCVVITIDPETSKREPAILRTVAQRRQGCLGVYGSTVEPGFVSINDPVTIVS